MHPKSTHTFTSHIALALALAAGLCFAPLADAPQQEARFGARAARRSYVRRRPGVSGRAPQDDAQHGRAVHGRPGR